MTGRYALNALIPMLVAATLMGCEPTSGPSTTVEGEPAELCAFADAYLQACGGEGGPQFIEGCTPELAADLLELDCGELPEALANAGLIAIASSSSSGGGPITLTEATNTSWPGSWFACKLGFKFACGTPACLLPGGAPIPGPGDSCIDWLQTDGCGQCGYYACREAQSQCGPDGYLEGYVGRYCNKFSSVTESGLSPAGQAWMADVRECLVETLDAQTDANTPCDEIESIGIDSHAICYTQEGFCDLPLTDWFSIVHTVDPGDVPLKQILATGHLCLQDWFTP